MNITFRVIAAVFVLASASACTTYTGDSLLKLPEQSNAYDQSKIVSKTKDGVSDMLDRLGVSDGAKISLEKIALKSVIRDSKSLKLVRVDNQLVVAEDDVNISFAKNSIIISSGTLNISHVTNSIIISSGALLISHSSNNVIVCNGDVDIGHDGSLGVGSLIISKGKIKISHASNTLIYAIKGVKISHARNVRAFNTRKSKTSWGHINNNLVKPLFREETGPNKSLQSSGSAGG